MTSLSSVSRDTNRQILYMSAAALCKQVGFDGVTSSSLETITELLQAYLSELTRSCRKYSELSHRTSPDMTDFKMALAEVGRCVQDVHRYSMHARNRPVPTVATKPPAEQKTMKTALQKINHPSYIPASFPEYPEVYSFVRTPTIREPISKYEVARERMAVQKQTSEESYARFLVRTNPSDVYVFENVNRNLYPTAGVTTQPCPYERALLLNEKTPETESTDSAKEPGDQDSEQSSSQSSSQTSSQTSSSSQASSNVALNHPAPVDNVYTRMPKRLKIKR